MTERWLRGRPPVDPSLPGTQQVIATGRPAFVEEVRDEMLRELATDDADLAQLRGLAVRSAITLPLATRGAPFGALSLIIGSSGRRYAPADLEFAGLVQGRIAIVLDNTGLSRAAARSEAIMSAALDSLEEAVTMNGPDGTTVYANQAAVRLLGATSAEEVVNGEPGAISARYRIYDEAGSPYDYRDLPAFRALAGEEHPEAKLVRNVVLATGEERWLLNKVSVLRDGDGGVDRIVNVIEDVTEVKNAEVRQRILGEATRVLSAAPDREQGLAGVAAVVVPDLAEWCAVDVDGPAASAGREPAAGDDRLVVGLRAGGGELGTLTLGRARPFSDEDRALGEELGRRAAIAVLDARPVGGARRDHARAAGGPAAAGAAGGARAADGDAVPPGGGAQRRRRRLLRRVRDRRGLDRLYRRRGRPGSARGDPDRAHALHAAVRRPAHRRPGDRDRGGQPRADRAARARARHARRGPAAPRGRRRAGARIALGRPPAPAAHPRGAVRELGAPGPIAGSSRTPSGR